MNVDYTRTAFKDIDWNINRDDYVDCPSTIDGSGVTIDLASPVDFINPIAKIVVNDDLEMDLQGTLAWVLAVSTGNPSGNRIVDLNDNDFEDASFWIGNNIVRYNIHQIAMAANVDINFRRYDTIKRTNLDRVTKGNAAYYLRQADIIWTVLSKDPYAMAAVTCNRIHAAKALIATANHRESEDRVAWAPNRQGIIGSMTYKHLKAAGSAIETFGRFMMIAGNEIWHYLDDPSLRRVAYLAAGKCPERYDEDGVSAFHDTAGNTDLDNYGQFVRDSCNINFRPNGPVILENFMYMGKSYAKVAVTDILGVGNAAMDRFPHGAIGASAIVTGCAMVSAMFQNIATKVPIATMPDIVKALAKIAELAKSKWITRSSLMALKDSMGAVIRIAYGYCNTLPDLRDLVNSYDSLIAFAHQDLVHVAAGTSLAVRVRELSADPSAVADAIKSAIIVGVEAIESVEKNGDISTSNIDFPDFHVENVTIYQNLENLTNEVARRRALADLTRV